MKTKIIFGAIFFKLAFCFTGNTFGQAYVPFPDSGAVWRQGANRYDFSGGINICWDYQLYTNGDTILNGTIYTSIYMAGTWGPFCNNLSYDGPSAGIREDSSKHIFVYNY